MNKTSANIAILSLSLALVGCGGGSGGDPDAATSSRGTSRQQQMQPPGAIDGQAPPPGASTSPAAMQGGFRPNSDAGIPVTYAGLDKVASLVLKPVSVRSDPFALMSVEKSYDTEQYAQSLSASVSFPLMYTPPPVVDVVPEIEPQPFRRLAGILVGDSVMALIDMGDGKLELVRPGQEIQGWTVASIDEEKAILKRKGNKLPRQIVVRLSSPNPG